MTMLNNERRMGNPSFIMFTSPYTKTSPSGAESPPCLGQQRATNSHNATPKGCSAVGWAGSAKNLLGIVPDESTAQHDDQLQGRVEVHESQVSF